MCHCFLQVAGRGYVKCFKLCQSPLWPPRTLSLPSQLSIIPKRSDWQKQEMCQRGKWKIWRCKRKCWPPHKCPTSKSPAFDATNILSARVEHILKKQKWCGDKGKILWLRWCEKSETFWQIVPSSEKWRGERSAWKASSLVWDEKRGFATSGQPATNHLLHTLIFLSSVAVNHLQIQNKKDSFVLLLLNLSLTKQEG